MNVPYDGLYVTGSTTEVTPNTTAAKFTTGWAAMAAADHGDLSIVASTTNSRLTCVPGVYLVTFTASVDQTDTSTTSEAGVEQNITFQLYKDQVAVAGTKCVLQTADMTGTQQAVIQSLIEVAAGANGQIEVFMSSDVAAGVDMIVREAQFTAIRLH